MKNIYIIFGDGDTGKSSIVRALTGMHNGRRTTLALVNGQNINIVLWIRSTQEADRDIQKVISEINAISCNDFLLTIRINPYNNLPGGAAYLTQLQQNFNIAGVAILTIDQSATTTYPQLSGNTIVRIPDVHNDSINAHAHVIRTAWGWI